MFLFYKRDISWSLLLVESYSALFGVVSCPASNPKHSTCTACVLLLEPHPKSKMIDFFLLSSSLFFCLCGSYIFLSGWSENDGSQSKSWQWSSKSSPWHCYGPQIQGLRSSFEMPQVYCFLPRGLKFWGIERDRSFLGSEVSLCFGCNLYILFPSCLKLTVSYATGLSLSDPDPCSWYLQEFLFYAFSLFSSPYVLTSKTCICHIQLFLGLFPPLRNKLTNSLIDNWGPPFPGSCGCFIKNRDLENNFIKQVRAV